MTEPTTDHMHDERISEAALWLAAPRERFGLSAVQACEAIRRAQELRRARAL